LLDQVCDGSGSRDVERVDGVDLDHGRVDAAQLGPHRRYDSTSCPVVAEEDVEASD
jgi:hypothetical protein